MRRGKEGRKEGRKEERREGREGGRERRREEGREGRREGKEREGKEEGREETINTYVVTNQMASSSLKELMTCKHRNSANSEENCTQ